MTDEEIAYLYKQKDDLEKKVFVLECKLDGFKDAFYLLRGGYCFLHNSSAHGHRPIIDVIDFNRVPVVAYADRLAEWAGSRRTSLESRPKERVDVTQG